MPRRGRANLYRQGSVFVEFDDMSSVDKFLNADPKPTWDGQELLIMSKCGCSSLSAAAQTF